MTIIEIEEHATSGIGNVAMVVYAPSARPLLRSAGDEPQPDELVKSDGELVDELRAATRPVAPDRFVD